MKKWLSMLFREEFLVIGFILVLIFCSYYPLVLQYLAHPPLNRVFLGSFGFTPDFWGNIISLQEGRLGHWDFMTKVTSTISSSPSWMKMEYRFLGQLNRLIPISQVLFFHFSRLVLSLILLGVIYKLISKIFKTKTERLAAFALALFSTSAGPDSLNLIYMWSPLGVFQRLAYYPHYLFGMIFVLLAIYYLAQAISTDNTTHTKYYCSNPPIRRSENFFKNFSSFAGSFLLRWKLRKDTDGRTQSPIPENRSKNNRVSPTNNLKYFTLACLFGFLTSWIHAGNSITLFLALPFYGLLLIADLLKNKQQLKPVINKFVKLFIFCFASSLPLFYIYKIGQTYPWSLLAKSDIKFNISSITSIWEMVGGVGPTFILGLIGSILIIKRKDELLKLILPWSFAYVLGFFFVWRFLTYNGNRFLQTPFFVMLAILSTITLKWAAEKLFNENSVFLRFIIKYLNVIPANELESIKINYLYRSRNTVPAGRQEFGMTGIKFAQNIFIWVSVGVILLVNLPAYTRSWKINRENFEPAGDYLYYSQPGNLAVVDWLGKNTQETDLVLADMINAELVSALAGNYCYITVHATELDNFYDLEKNVTLFYRQNDPDSAQKFLIDNNIKYVFWSDNERILSETLNLNYPFLTKVFEFENASLFKIK